MSQPILCFLQCVIGPWLRPPLSSPGCAATWYAGDAGHLGECVFAPDPGGTAEDDGWILNAAHDSERNQSEVLVLDAHDVARGPIARVQIPQRMPAGFHANWFPAD